MQHWISSCLDSSSIWDEDLDSKINLNPQMTSGAIRYKAVFLSLLIHCLLLLPSFCWGCLINVFSGVVSSLAIFSIVKRKLVVLLLFPFDVM